MFAAIDADIFVLVDGDATYDAESAPAMAIVNLLGDTLILSLASGVILDSASLSRREARRLAFFQKLKYTLLHQVATDRSNIT